MGLDMYLYRANLHGHSVDQAIRVENYLDLQQWNAAHPDGTHTLYEWCHQNPEDMEQKALADLTPEFTMGYSYWDTRKAYGHMRIFKNCAYWRKANAIHRWFVENVQNGVDDCDIYVVTKEQLETLRNTCQTVLEQVKLEESQVCVGTRYENGKSVPMMETGMVVTNPEVCDQHLPAQSGFFFGNTDYDEYYVNDLKITCNMLTEVLDQTNWDTETVTYQSSW